MTHSRRALLHQLLASILVAGTTLPFARSSSSGDCTAGRIPVVWPLGDSGFGPGRLLNSHGQFLELTPGDRKVHRGIDIAACVDDYVYAVESGTVDLLHDDGGSGYGFLYVRDDDDPTQGWNYAHLQDIKVALDEHVERDQVLGRIASFPEASDFDHLHLQRMSAGLMFSAGEWVPRPKIDAYAVDGGHPLPWLAARMDDARPLRLEFGPPHPITAGYLFYKEASDTLVLPADLGGTAVDVVARVSEVFPGVGTPACGIVLCGAPPEPLHVVPLRMTFTIFEHGGASGAAASRVSGVPLFNNVIDLEGPIQKVADFAKYTYRAGSVGTYDDRAFLVNLTNCPADGSGFFTFSSGEAYRLQLVLEDASGNVDRFERTLEIP